MKKWFIRVSTCIAFLLLFMYVNNTTWFSREQEEPWFLAHRGVAQTFRLEGVKSDTCTAERIHTPVHSYIENTIPSMTQAFLIGAETVELDLRPTKDENFAVFHDWTLDCRTNGTGLPSDYTLDELKKLDVGYGYTADHGETYPLRGKGVGLMPSLEEVLKAFPKESLLLHIKSNEASEGELLARKLMELSQERLEQITVYGGNHPIQALKERMPQLRVMSKQTIKQCLLSYEAVGWTGYVPDSCKETQLHIPLAYARYLWGWPEKFMSRMITADTRVVLVGGSGQWSEGFDSIESLEQIPPEYSGGIWTNRIDLLGQK